MENSQLLDDCPSSDILCDICGEVVEIHNNDLLFSRELHNQSHIKQNNLKKLDKISDLTEDCLQLPGGSNTSSEPLDLLSSNLSEICKIENENGLKTLQEQSLEAITLKESLVLNSQLPNENDLKINNLKERLDKILNSLPKKFSPGRNVSWININELGQVVCILCTCVLGMSATSIKHHLSCKRHLKNKKKFLPNNLFENIPETLQSFINIIEGDKRNVLCNKCNVKISAHNKCLLEHLEGAVHSKVLAKPTEAQSKNEDMFKRILDDLSEQFETSCIQMNEKGEIICIVCNCPVSLCKNVIIVHLAGTKHVNKKKIVNRLFENIPGNLQGNKSFINVPAGDKTHVFCSKCNIKIPAFHTDLLEHLQGASHVRSLAKPIEEQSRKDDKSGIVKLPELQQSKTCEVVISKNDLVEKVSFMSLKMSSEASELKCILDDIPKQTSCIKMNENGDITCVICNCSVHLRKEMIEEHLSGMRHKKNEKKKVINSLFKNILKTLNCDKSFIQALAGDKRNVFCSKCNVKILANRNSLLEHLQGDEHSTLLGRRQ